MYEAYWKTAFERQEIFFKKHSADPIYRKFKFCNVYRASDRVSQFLIRDVIYSGSFEERDVLFRIFLFRLLNKIETWKSLEGKVGGISLKSFNFEKYDRVLEEIKLKNRSIYGNAFILCANKVFGYDKKHENHLALLDHVFNMREIGGELLRSKTLEELFLSLRELPLIGNFMAYQIAIDFNYSEVFDFSENDFTVAGPGAIRGIRKCFVDVLGKSNEYVIKYMVDNQEKEFRRLGLRFRNLFGRPMQAIDCQGWFCELDKYSRVKFPGLKSNRKKIKAIYRPVGEEIRYFYPPKWKLKTNE